MRFGALEEGVSNQARQKERADAEGGEARTRGPDCASGAVRVCRWARDRTVSDGSSLALVSPRAGVLTGVMEPGEDAGRFINKPANFVIWSSRYFVTVWNQYFLCFLAHFSIDLK